MLLRYDFADYSTDIWSLGCVFAALLFRTPIYFTAETPTEQLLLISQVGFRTIQHRGHIFSMSHLSFIYCSSCAPTSKNALLSPCNIQTLGTDELLAYTRKYSLEFNSSLVEVPARKMPWERMVTAASRDFATAEALDLLSHMLV